MSFPESYPIIQELESLETLKQEFDMTLEEGVKSGNFENTQILQHQLEIRRDGLRDRLNPFERMINLREQYNSQRKILEHTGVLASLSSGERGITDIDGNEWPMPSYEEILKRMKNKKEILSEKVEQGFGKLLVVPQGISLDQLIEIYRQSLIKHHQEKKLFATKKTPQDPDMLIDLDVNTPISVWNGYKHADYAKTLVYHPKSFFERHYYGKKDIIQTEGGWSILLIENLPNIPGEGEGITINNRPQLEANKTPDEYLTLLATDSRYQHESDFTPEAWLLYALTNLEETDQVIDDYGGNGNASLNLGGYLPFFGGIPHAFWDHNKTSLGKSAQNNRALNIGARFAVRI